ncbi:MAG: radical SAM protein [Desulfobacterales bacterium]|nr:radical SAM protein [Desulfobacterales bacterium]
MNTFRILHYPNDKTFSYGHFKNRALATYSYLTGNPTNHAFPTKLHIEITNVCNLGCIMCPRSYMSRKKGMMDMGLFKKIINESKGKVEFIYLHLFGEPLMHPHIIDMIKYCKEAGIFTGLATNATLLDNVKSKEIANSGLDFMVISFDGINKEEYEKIRRGGNYEKTLEYIKGFLQIKGKKPHTVLQLIYMNFTRDKIKEYTNFWGSFNIEAVRIKPLQTWSGEIENINELSTKEYFKGQKPCDRPWRHLCILWDGTATPCEFDFNGAYPLGNIRDQSIEEIWNNERIIELRNQHISHNINEVKICKSCTYQAPNIFENIVLTSIDVLTTTKLISDMGK